MSADRPWHIQVNLHVIRRGLVEGFPVLCHEMPELRLPRPRKSAHEDLPGGASPAVGNTLVYPLPELVLLRGLDAPKVDVAALVPGSCDKHPAPLRCARTFFGGRWTIWLAWEGWRTCGATCHRGGCTRERLRERCRGHGDKAVMRGRGEEAISVTQLTLRDWHTS